MTKRELPALKQIFQPKETRAERRAAEKKVLKKLNKAK
jgi:hypothetical protein